MAMNATMLRTHSEHSSRDHEQRCHRCHRCPSPTCHVPLKMRRVFRKKGGTFRPHVSKDDRDKLLFDITEITPPPRKLGTFRLEPSAACGDLISARVRVEGESEKVEQPFIIKKVSWKYEYVQGSYRMVAKGADVKMVSRDSTEKFLNRMLPSKSPADDAEEEALDRAPSRQREMIDDYPPLTFDEGVPPL